MSNMTDFKDFIFQSMKDVRAGKIDTQTAKDTASLAQVYINAAKVQVEYIKATKTNEGQGFFDEGSTPGALNLEDTGTSKTETGTKNIKGNVTIHKMRG